MRVVSQTEALAEIAREALDAEVSVGLSDTRALRSADVILLAHPEWDRIWGWRVGGLSTPVVVSTLTVPERDRARLEPLVLIREPSVDALASVLAHIDGGHPLGVLSVGRGVIDLAGSVFRPTRGDPVSLTSQEVRLLGYLGARSNRAVPREELRLQVWEHVRPVPGRSVDMAVSRVRQKLERDPKHPRVLVTVRNAGYRLMVRAPRRPRQRPLHPLVGRRDLLRRIKALDTVTLWGAPGVGTTRLAHEAAGVGAIVVDLEGIRSERVALDAIARVALLPTPRGDRQEACCELSEGLAAQATTVVLDRAEGVSGLLERLGESVRLIATCRRRPLGTPALQIEPLSDEHSRALLDLELARLGRAPDEAWRARAVKVAAGSPRALLECASQEGPVAPSRLPSTHESWRGAWRRLAPESRALLTLLSRFTEVNLELATRIGGAHADRGWSELVNTGFVFSGRVAAMAAHVTSEMHPAGWVSAGRVHLEHCINRARHGDFVPSEDLVRAMQYADAHEVRTGIADLVVARDVIDARTGCSLALRRSRLDAALELLGHPPGVLFRRAELMRNRDRPKASAQLRQVFTESRGHLRCEAGISLASLIWLSDGPQAADEFLASLEPPNRTLELVVLAERAQVQDFLVDAPGLSTTQAILVDLMEELAIEGAMAHAVRIGLQVERRARVTGLGDRVALMARLSTWSTETDALLRAHVDVIHATVLPPGAEREFAFARAEEVFERVQPIRLWQVRFQRAQVALDEGELHTARAHFEAYRAWAVRNGSASDVGDIDLWLCAVFADDGDWSGLARTADALCRRHDEPHYVSTANVWRSVAAFFRGEEPSPPDEAHLSPVALRWWRAIPSTDRAPWPDDGGVPGLDAVWTRRKQPVNASERLVARLRDQHES